MSVTHALNDSWTSVAKCAIPLLALCNLFANSSLTSAATRSWNIFGGGNFNTAHNWFEPGIPDGNDFVSFQVGSGNPYTVTFPGNQPGVGGTATASYFTSHLRVRDNGVTF